MQQISLIAGWRDRAEARPARGNTSRLPPLLSALWLPERGLHLRLRAGARQPSELRRRIARDRVPFAPIAC